jgi:hypothetical protein
VEAPPPLVGASMIAALLIELLYRGIRNLRAHNEGNLAA